LAGAFSLKTRGSLQYDRRLFVQGSAVIVVCRDYCNKLSAKTMINGLIEAFQPDYVVETRDGQIKEYGVNFPEMRSISFAELLARDEQNRCQIGIDLRSICHDMYQERFQFVQRHGPEVVIPTCKDSRYALLFLVMFGAFPENSDVAQVYINALDGEYKESAKIRLCRFENQIENLSP
jgi:hypothetical protein